MRHRYLFALASFWVAGLALSGCACRRASSPPPLPGREAGRGGATAQPKTPDALLTEEQCRACRGQFRAHGLDPTPRCVCGTADAGRVCRAKEDCEGDCISDGKAHEIVDPGPPPRGYFIGRCSPLRTTFGCNHLLGPKGPPVRLDQPPEQLCVD